MVNLKNNKFVLKCFVLLLTFFILFSCGNQKYQVSKIVAKKIELSNSSLESKPIDSFVKPYRDYITADLSSVLAYCPETLDKSIGTWQTNIGNFFADVTISKCNIIFKKREGKSIDICLLNNGGIRSVIPKGNITAKNAYEVMPFENSATVIALKGEHILELVDYIITEKKPHPLSGLKFTISKENKPKDIEIQGNKVDLNTTYYVVTNDYLANGGDNMTFFKKGTERYDLEYKLRNLLIDHFKEVDTLKINSDIRIKTE